MLRHAVACTTGVGRDRIAREEAERRERAARRRRIPVVLGSEVEAALDREQRAAIDAVRAGDSIVLLGRAGTGKTFVLETLLDGLDAAGVNVLRTGSTGRAAAALRGVTLHGAVGLGLLHDKSMAHIIRRVRQTPKLRQRWIDARVLVVDEFTMMSADDMAKIEAVARTARAGAASRQTFGGLCVVLAGDPCQLQCIDDERVGACPLFMSPLLASVAPRIILLRHIHRQRSANFCGMLEDVRRGQVTPRVRAVLEDRSGAPLPAGAAPVRIFARRHDVAETNDDVLAALPGRTHEYGAAMYVFTQERKERKDSATRRGKKGAGSAEKKEHGDDDDDDHFCKWTTAMCPVHPRSAAYDRILTLPQTSAPKANGAGMDAMMQLSAPSNHSALDCGAVEEFARLEGYEVPRELRGCDTSLLDRRDVPCMRLAARTVSEGNLRARVKLRVGAQVMLVRNVPGMARWGLVNGLTGVVVGFSMFRETEAGTIPAGAEVHCGIPTPPAPAGAVVACAKGASATPAALPCDMIRPPEHDAPSQRYDLTEKLADDLAVPLGVHPWSPAATAERFSRCNKEAAGSAGTESCAVPDGWPVVQFPGVGRFICKPMSFDVEVRRPTPDMRVMLGVKQVPLMMCSAITVHKVQGMTLEWASVHLDGRMSQLNQAYVALSRVTHETGLTLTALDLDAIRADERAVAFMDAAEDMADASGVARTADVVGKARGAAGF